MLSCWNVFITILTDSHVVRPPKLSVNNTMKWNQNVCMTNVHIGGCTWQCVLFSLVVECVSMSYHGCVCRWPHVGIVYCSLLSNSFTWLKKSCHPQIGLEFRVQDLMKNCSSSAVASPDWRNPWEAWIIIIIRGRIWQRHHHHLPRFWLVTMHPPHSFSLETQESLRSPDHHGEYEFGRAILVIIFPQTLNPLQCTHLHSSDLNSIMHPPNSFST